MPQGIRLQPDSTGILYDAYGVTVASVLYYRGASVIADSADPAGLAAVVNTDALAAAYGIVVRQSPPVSPRKFVLANIALAPSAAADQDGAAIPNGKTGKFMKAIVSSSRQCEWTIKSVLAGVETVIGYAVTNSSSFTYEPAHKDFDQASQAGFFRLTAYNFDPSTTGALGTLYYDVV